MNESPFPTESIEQQIRYLDGLNSYSVLPSGSVGQQVLTTNATGAVWVDVSQLHPDVEYVETPVPPKQKKYSLYENLKLKKDE